MHIFMELFSTFCKNQFENDKEIEEFIVYLI